MQQLFPDWGEPAVKMIDGEMCVNAAGIIEVAKVAGTPQARKFLRDVLRIWRQWERRYDIPIGVRQQHTLKAAIRASGFNPVDAGREGV